MCAGAQDMKIIPNAIRPATLAWAVFLGAAAMGAAAQNYPTKPVRLVVASTPGGGTDITARAIAPKMSEFLGQQVVVENRAGATTTIGGEHVARSDPDGYTLLLGVSSITIIPHLLRGLRYDPMAAFAPVSQVVVSPNIVVAHPSLPVKTVKDLIAFAKKRPGELNFAAGGAGSSQHLAIELFKSMAKVNMVHVPYKGQGLALIDTIAGHVSLMMANVVSALPHVRNDKLRALGVTGPKRISIAPNIPTVSEAGLPGYAVLQWYGVLAPAKTPRVIIDKIHAAIVRVVADPAITKRFTDNGGEAVGNTPEEFAAIMQADYQKWGKVVREAGIKVNQR
jgi:tripartite-type tricarboxylate transporter receptor subunit TctC